MNAEECERIIRDKILKDASKGYDGMAVARCNEIRRQENCKNEKIWCVVDAGEAGFESHALIRLAAPNSYTRTSVKKVRGELLALFEYWPNLEYFGA